MRPIITLLALVVLTSCGNSPPADDPWRADAKQLLGRTERLAAAGDVGAARGTLAELERRGDPALVDRGRAALARAMLTSGDSIEAETLLGKIAWADKAPAVAGELIALDLAIRWQRMLRGGRLASGMIPSIEADDSDHGAAGGAWSLRATAWNSWNALLVGGVRMVEREGGRVAMPASSGQLALARWAHGESPWSATESSLTGDAKGLLEGVHLLLSEHDPERSLSLAEQLWSSGAVGSDEAYTALRQWQLRRRALDGRLVLWPFPLVDSRLDALASRFTAAEAIARGLVADERDLGEAGLQQAVATAATVAVASERAAPVAVELQPTILSNEEGDEATGVSGRPSAWRLAVQHDGLALSFSEPVIAVGEPVHVRVQSEYRGEHRLELWRIEDSAVWDKLRQRPRREDLPSVPDQVRTLDPGVRDLALVDLSEGRWVVALSARACPVAVLSSVRIAATAMHVHVGADGAVVWTVNRGDGRGLATPLRVHWELDRDVIAAAGVRWTEGTPAWRSGFTEGYLGHPDAAWVAAGAAAERESGRVAGLQTAAVDPAVNITEKGATGADGTLRLELPAALVGRTWSLVAEVDRVQAHEQVRATWGTLAHWRTLAVCWPDKPLVRPGETLRFAGLVRLNDGDVFRLADKPLAGALLVAGEAVWQGQLALDDHGMISGAVPIPAGAAEGPVILRLDGVEHHLATCDRLALPPVMIHVSCPDGPVQLAGETRQLRVRLVDAAGTPMAATLIAVAVVASAIDQTKLPVEAPSNVITDLAGEAVLAIPTAAGREASWVVTVTVIHNEKPWCTTHAWSTTVFPFPLSVSCASQVSVGDLLRVSLSLPAAAPVRLQLARDGLLLGQSWSVVGGADGTAEALLAIDDRHRTANRLQIIADLPGGGEAKRSMSLNVEARPRVGAGESVACIPTRGKVQPGETLEVTVGTAIPGRDVLLVAGSASIIHHASKRVEQATTAITCDVTSAWSPQIHMQAIAWMGANGFTASRTTEISVLPVDRLLRVTLTPDRAEPRPGETVRVRVSVRDWQDRPVVGAGLTIGAVDQRLYALAEDQTPDLWRFFHERQRPWLLAAGVAVDQGRITGLTWRSIVRRWQHDPEGASQVGGRCGYGCCRLADREKSATMIRSLGTESDPTILWLSGVVTDANGLCEAVIVLPSAAGTWRLTARVADTSATVMVGEVRTILSATRRLDLHVGSPRLARTGDRLVLPIEVVNQGEADATTEVRLGEERQQLSVRARSRRTIPMTYVVPAVDLSQPVRRCGDLLGRVVRVEAELSPGTAEALTVGTDLLIIPDGLPERVELQLVADVDGVLRLPMVIPAGSLCHAEVRAWPNLGARRDEELLRWRLHDDAKGAMAWLLAAPGAQRRAELARRWPLLDQSIAAHVVRLAGVRLGMIAGPGISDVPKGALGEWLRARARQLGMPLSVSSRHVVDDGSLRDQIALADIALAEGWSEGRQLRRGLDEAIAGSTDALVLALALDAARLDQDEDGQRILGARLVSVAWDDPLSAVLAADVLPAHGPATTATVTFNGSKVEALAGAQWSGQLDSVLSIVAAPGAVVSLSLRWQKPAPAASISDELHLYADDGGAFSLIEPGDSIMPGQRIAIYRPASRVGHVRFTLPAGLTPFASEFNIDLTDSFTYEWLPRPADLSIVRAANCAWKESEPQRAMAIAAWDAALLRATPNRIGSRSSVQPVHMDDGDQVICLNAGQAIVCIASMEGSLGWSPVLVTAEREAWSRMPALQVSSSVSPPQVAPAGGHPLRRELVAAATDPILLAWLLDRPRLDATAILTITPHPGATVYEVLDHPLCAQPGHWTEAIVRRWIDEEPELQAVTAEPKDGLYLILSELARRAESSRGARRQAQALLHGPQRAPAHPSADLRGWYAAMSAAVGGIQPDFDTWIWGEDIDADLLHILGYDGTLDGWSTFLRRECGLRIRLGLGCVGDSSAPSGQRLGTVDLAGRDLIVTRTADGGFLIATTKPDLHAAPAPLSLDWHEQPFDEAVAAFDELLANRGLPPLEYAADLTTLSPITLRLANVRWYEAAKVIAKVGGFELGGRAADLQDQP